MDLATSPATAPAQASGALNALRVLPMPSVIGAEIQGVNVSAGLSSEQFAQVLAALHEHSVIVLRGQTLTPRQQMDFAARFGTLRTSFYNRYGVPGQPELSVVSNILKDGEAIGIADAGMLWHTDGSYLRTPDMYTVLYGLEIPMRDGQAIGDTVFASAWHAFTALPLEQQEHLRSLRAVHSFTSHIEKKRRKGQLKRAELTAEQKAALPDVDHPVVRTHPVTGRPCLFITEGHTSRIVGLSEEDSDTLLEELSAHITQPRFQYRHRWQPGDLIVWDNAALQHLAVFDYGDIPRRLHRAGVLGAVPF